MQIDMDLHLEQPSSKLRFTKPIKHWSPLFGEVSEWVMDFSWELPEILMVCQTFSIQNGSPIHELLNPSENTLPTISQIPLFLTFIYLYTAKCSGKDGLMYCCLEWLIFLSVFCVSVFWITLGPLREECRIYINIQLKVDWTHELTQIKSHWKTNYTRQITNSCHKTVNWESV